MNSAHPCNSAILFNRSPVNNNTKKVCILDYGSGNTRSVYNILQSLEPNTLISNQAADIEAATHIILPGVGAFGASMQKIREKIPLPVLEQEVLQKKKPFLGICVGMQVLADTGYEFGEEQGLGWIKGEVRKLPVDSLPLPHVGWNNVQTTQPSPITAGFSDEIDFYFVHSYAFYPKNPGHSIAFTTYQEKFTAMVAQDNIFGVQFHPEKSQRAGLMLMKNFLELP